MVRNAHCLTPSQKAEFASVLSESCTLTAELRPRTLARNASATSPRKRPRMTNPHAVTQLIKDADAHVPTAVNRLFDLLYKDLYRVARGRVHQSGSSLDLSATSLVHETYERLVQLDELKVSDRQQFFTYAATVMRSIVVDMARARLADRRGGGRTDVPLDTLLEGRLAVPLDETVLEVSDALTQLQAVDSRLAQVVEMRYFAGMSVEETALAMGVTTRTVGRDWLKARSLLAAILVAK